MDKAQLLIADLGRQNSGRCPLTPRAFAAQSPHKGTLAYFRRRQPQCFLSTFYARRILQCIPEREGLRVMSFALLT